MLSLSQCNPSPSDECGLHLSKVFMFWLEAPRCFCPSHPSKTNFPTVCLIHSSVKNVSRLPLFLHICPRQWQGNSLFLRLLTFLVWVKLTGILIPWSPSPLLFEQLFAHLNACSHLWEVQFLLCAPYSFSQWKFRHATNQTSIDKRKELSCKIWIPHQRIGLVNRSFIELLR